MTPPKKKELKKADEFVSFWTRTARWAAAHQKHLIIALVAVAVVAAAVWGYFEYQFRIEAKAWAAYEKVLLSVNAAKESKSEAQRKAEVSAALEQLVAERPGTNAARQAHLDLAGLNALEARYDKAIEHYLSFLKGLRPQDPLRPMVAEALGQCFEAKGQLNEAAAWYRKVAADPDLTALSLWNLGRVQELAGQKDEAKKTYQKLLNEHPQSTYTSLVHDRLRALSQ